ncbi:hypothetical protein C8R46DRAFT_901348, partial [Mycena filopes]
WSNTLILPLYVATASIIALLLQFFWDSTLGNQLRTALFKTEPPERQEATSDDAATARSIHAHIQKHGGKTIFAYKTARLGGCLLLLGLSNAALALDDDDAGKIKTTTTTSHVFLQSAMCAIYFYTALLAVLSISTTNPKWSRLAVRHLNTVLLATLGVYLYRDVFPLATTTRAPMDDLWEGALLLWSKIAVLFAVAGIIPLAIPRQYTPLDVKNPTPVPNPEQTASILSSALYTWLDPTIYLAYRMPHLPFDALPPLCDYDRAQDLKVRAFPHLDTFTPGTKKHSKPRRHRHIFWGFLWVFRWEWATMALVLIISGLANFVSPLALNRILKYLEDPTAESAMKPWFWILLLFLGPVVYSLAFQWICSLGCVLNPLPRLSFESQTPLPPLRTSAIVTQLVFEHALRMRVSASSSSSSFSSSPSTPAASTPSPSNENNTQKSRININNLLTTDLSNINEARNALFLVVLIPLQVVGCVVFLERVLGWSAFVGMGTMIALFPLPGYAARLQSNVQETALQKTDARVQVFTETMTVVRMIKMFGWETHLTAKVAEKREDELTWIWWRKVVYTASGILNFIVPTVVMVVTYGAFEFCRDDDTVIMNQPLTASRVFSSMAIFDLLSGQLWLAFYSMRFIVKAKVSLGRLDEFLNGTELLDSFQTQKAEAEVEEEEDDRVGFRDAAFSWANDDDENANANANADGTLTPSSHGHRFILRIEGELLFKLGGFNLVVGPTGSGKTSLLMALLGEMHMIRSSPASRSSWFNLPRAPGGVSYAAQESWVLNDTIRNNILFHAPLNTQRYNKVLHQCGLERDLELFEAGDETEVGEKGLTLSGGQKARVTLARAIYAESRVIILDDVLAALDVHTAKWVVDKCLAGDLIKGRTVILVTHNVAMTSKLADFVVSVGLDGRVRGRDSVSEALVTDKVLAEEVSREEEVLAMAEAEDKVAAPASTEDDESKAKASGKLIVADEIEIGSVSWEALEMFFSAHAANPVLFFIGLFVAVFAIAVTVRLETWYLGYWARSAYMYSTDRSTMLNARLHSGLIVLADITVYCIAYIYFTVGSFNASKEIHKRLVVGSMILPSSRWLDVTPTSRIITRCTGDTDAVDDSLSEGLWSLMDSTLGIFTRFFAVVIFTPVFFIPGMVVGILGVACGRLYMASQISVKREQSNVRAPVLAHIGAAITGLASVRAYGAQDTLIQVSIDRINRLTRASRTFANLNRWATVRLGKFSSAQTRDAATCLAYYLVYVQSYNASNIGFSLNMALGFSGALLGWTRLWNQFEVQSNRQQYIEIEQEPKATAAGVPPAYWPASGDISVQNLSAKYSADGPKVLHGISFDIKSGERVGVVGRTGSGKSSLTLALLRCIFTDGTVYYDGLPTSSLNLEALRANVTIIPQIPELLAGSLRANLDILGQFDDAVLNDALRAAGLFALQAEMEEGKLTLDTEIAAGGNNLSVGERQIIALARAIVRRSKLLILDEDYKTDAVIQSSLRTELPSDTTLFTVAHRLHSIMDADKIMVLDAGRIVEFDSPKVLLQNEQGLLRALVDESGDKEVLYKMVQQS